MPGGRPLRVLLVEDEPKLAYAVRVLLELDGSCVVVDTAPDGAVGVGAALLQRPDVVVLDIRTPVVDGIDAATQILSAWPDARIIFYSADDDELARAQATHPCATLRKDALADELVPAVHTAAHVGGAPA